LPKLRNQQQQHTINKESSRIAARLCGLVVARKEVAAAAANKQHSSILCEGEKGK
jgi:hypothetical protein